MSDQPEPCKHPSSRLFCWFVDNPLKPKNRILCVCCCDCGEVLLGGVSTPEKTDNLKPEESKPRLKRN